MRLVLIIFLFSACKESKPWFRYFPDTGTYSSPAISDLNSDGVGDIVMGAGSKEDQPADTAVVAIDGKTGNLLWSIPGRNQYVGKAVFVDVTGDDIADVFIGGRWAEFAAIDGTSGKVLWRFFEERSQPDPSYAGWYNFTSAQLIPDQDSDGIKDLIVSNGGDAKAEPGDTIRPAGKLLILSSATGKILANVTVPDKREIYMSVVCLENAEEKETTVYFGTGGETIGGHLYRTSIAEIMTGNIDNAIILATSADKGFVAPPALADITGDMIPDIIINTAAGYMLSIDGATDSLLWSVHFPGTEAYTVPAPGYFNADSVPDFFCNFAIGVFPELRRSVRFLADGRDGNIIFCDTINSFQYASPVAADLNADGADEAILYQSELKRNKFDEVYYSYIQVMDFANDHFYSIGDSIPATNLASTPWIGDLNGDKSIELIYSAVKFHDVQFNLARPLGLMIGIQPLGKNKNGRISWGGYMGTNGDGLF